jgi:hypothetical protein
MQHRSANTLPYQLKSDVHQILVGAAYQIQQLFITTVEKRQFPQ